MWHRLPALALVLALAPVDARADLTDWAAAVQAGTAPRFAAVNPPLHGTVDIGPHISPVHATYEVLVNAGNYNGGAGPAISPGSALIGARNTAVGEQACVKFESWPDTGQYGVTNASSFDVPCGPNRTGVDLHLVFVCDSLLGVTTVFENGLVVGTAPASFRMAGTVGIGIHHDAILGPSEWLAGTIYGVAVYDAKLSPAEIVAHRNAFFRAPIGSAQCAANPNSTGLTGRARAFGSTQVAWNDVQLVADRLPTASLGFFLTSRTAGFVANPGGSSGNLCLAGAIGRYQRDVRSSGVAGTFALTLDLAALPSPAGPIAAAPGETWFFQAWHRDTSAQGATSNFTDAVGVTFL